MNNHRIAWRASIAALGLLTILLLGACTAQTGHLDEQGLQPHLNADLHIPEELNPHQEGSFSITLAQGGRPASADTVTFEFWPEGQQEHAVSLEGVQAEEGVYNVQYDLPGNGIYVVRCVATSGSMEVMPAKRFAIGEEAVLELATLEKQEADGSSGEADGAAGHHH